MQPMNRGSLSFFMIGIALSACSSAPPKIGAPNAAPRLSSVDGRRAAEARAALVGLANQYSGVRGYRDVGTVISTTWGNDYFSTISYFETAFLRGRGFRFRFLREDGDLVAAIWMVGDRVDLWVNGKVTREKSLDTAASAISGITWRTSSLVAAILFGKPISDCAPAFSGWEEVGCGKCAKIVFDKSVPGHASQFAISIDVERRSLRRAQRVDVRTRRQDVDDSETVILYRPEFDPPDQDSLVEAIERQPW